MIFALLEHQLIAPIQLTARQLIGTQEELPRLIGSALVEAEFSQVAIRDRPIRIGIDRCAQVVLREALIGDIGHVVEPLGGFSSR
jgi:hypothetical protein